jgi:predicted phosphodiesterase
MSARLLLAFLAVAYAAWPAFARNEDGTLGLIQTPNNGLPALVLAGDTFDVMLQTEATLRLVDTNGTAVPLEATLEARPGDTFAARCTVPPAAAPGTYGLVAEGNGRSDTNLRAVYVLPEFPEYYIAAHVTDTHVGSNRHPRPSEVIVAEVFQAVNTSEVDICFVTGDLTDQGMPEQFRSFLELLDTCTMPTFVVPGNHDRQALNYEQYFGVLTYSFTYGRDGYLAFDSKDYLVADELGAQDGELEKLRREIKGARWSVGLTHRYEPMMGIRSQLTLFVDNPLDVLLFGHWHHEPAEDQVVIPWGQTKWIVTPAAINGEFRLIDMTARGPLPRPAAKPGTTGAEVVPEPEPAPAPTVEAEAE